MTQYPVATLTAPHAKLIPVLHVENPDHAEPLLEALVSAGVKILEVTLRSACGPEVIKRMRALGTDAVGGAFLAPRELIESADWKTIHERGKVSVAAAAG